jgi:hypothetical protein
MTPASLEARMVWPSGSLRCAKFSAQSKGRLSEVCQRGTKLLAAHNNAFSKMEATIGQFEVRMCGNFGKSGTGWLPKGNLPMHGIKFRWQDNP